MKILVVYSSKTGNTKQVAEAVHSICPEGTPLHNVKEAPAPADFDLVLLGFWVDRGAPDGLMLDYMDKVKNKMVGLFGTLGAWPDSEHAQKSMQNGVDRLENCTVLGTFMCQGKIDPKLLAAMAKMREENNPHPMTEERKARIEEAAKHPNDADFAKAREVFREVLQKAEEACA